MLPFPTYHYVNLNLFTVIEEIKSIKISIATDVKAELYYAKYIIDADSCSHEETSCTILTLKTNEAKLTQK